MFIFHVILWYFYYLFFYYQGLLDDRAITPLHGQSHRTITPCKYMYPPDNNPPYEYYSLCIIVWDVCIHYTAYIQLNDMKIRKCYSLLGVIEIKGTKIRRHSLLIQITGMKIRKYCSLLIQINNMRIRIYKFHHGIYT